MYWKLIKKRKPQKKFKATRAARRLVTSRRIARPMLLPQTGLFSICNPFNGRWSRTPVRWPFKQRRVVLRSLKKSKTRRILLHVQGLYLRWVRFFGQQYFWFSRQSAKPNILGSRESMSKFLKWAKTRDVFVSDLSIGIDSRRGLVAGSTRSASRFCSFGLRRKLY